MSASYEYDKNVKSNDLIKEANEIWNYVMETRLYGKLITISDQNELMGTLVKKWHDFMAYYALIARYMVSFGLYHPKALREWLDYIEKNGAWKTEDEHMRYLAKYVRILHKWCTPERKYGDNFEQAVYDNLRDEREQFKKGTQKVANEFKDNLRERIQRMDKEDRDELLKSIRK